jgi:hypothetical protein
VHHLRENRLDDVFDLNPGDTVTFNDDGHIDIVQNTCP